MLPIRRLETLTDGVFAIAMTLLVLGVELPHGGGSLWSRLWQMAPRPGGPQPVLPGRVAEEWASWRRHSPPPFLHPA